MRRVLRRLCGLRRWLWQIVNRQCLAGLLIEIGEGSGSAIAYAGYYTQGSRRGKRRRKSVHNVI